MSAEMTAEHEPDMTPEQLAEYDAETVRLVLGAESDAGRAEQNYISLKADAADAKKVYEGYTSALRALIRDRESARGKRPPVTLLDMIESPRNEWREVRIDSLDIADGIKAQLSFEPIATAGELYDAITSFDPADGAPFGLALGDVATIRMKLREMIDLEAMVSPSEELPTIPDDLWRSYPLAKWTQFRVTLKDVEKLAAGEVKRETGRVPVVTVGDLSDFATPTGSGYTRQYADVKGIGTAGADRISDAECKFWAWWKDGGEAEFARERGVTNGNAAPGGPGSEDPGTVDPSEEDIGTLTPNPVATEPDYRDGDGLSEEHS